jgi:hypothetical protein
MAISENPKRSTARDAKAERFIAQAGKQPGDNEDSEERKPIMLRIKKGMLARIDKAAERRGLTRTGFIIASTTKELEEMESGR